jgi:phage tail sheath gpL-like
MLMTISTAVDLQAVARVLGISVEFVDTRGGAPLMLPQMLAVIGQGATAASYTTEKFQASSAVDVGNRVGFGSPLHLAALQLFPANGDGIGIIPAWFFPLLDDGAGVVAAGDITPSGTGAATATFRARIGGVLSPQFVYLTTDTVAERVTKLAGAINAEPAMPVTAVDSVTTVDLSSKWLGESANDITIEIIGELQGHVFSITTMTGGAANPAPTAALAQFGNNWFTMALSCLNIADTNALDEFETFGVGRWDALVRRPLVFFTGNTETTVAAATAVSDARKADRINAQLVAPNSPELPLTVAARQLARIIVLANNNPPHDYGARVASGIVPGPEADQWAEYPERDEAVKKGSSTIEVVDGEVTIGDVVTFYHPTGDPLPAYRYVVDIVKLQQVLYNIQLEFSKQEWIGAPLLPDADATVNPAAKQPKAARSAVSAIVVGLGLQAVLADTATTVAKIKASIGTGNPKRLELVVPVKLAGNTNIISIDLKFGFNFGSQAAA